MATGNVPVPAPHIEDEPTVQLCINREWAHTLIGQIWTLRYPEAWGGTLDENRRARGEIKNLITMLMSEETCDMCKCCCDTIIFITRINIDTGRFERSSDGGATWTPDPADPINSTVLQQPIVRDTTDHTKCDAATNFLEHFTDIVLASSENLGTAITVTELVIGVVAFLLNVFIIVVTGGTGSPIAVTISTAIFGAAVAVFNQGKEAFDAYWTSEVYDAILCAAYCTIGDNGQFSQTQWEDCKHEIRQNVPAGAALDFVMTSVNAAGYVGASNMASYGAAAMADCSDCPCAPGCDNNFLVYASSPNYFGIIVHQTRTYVIVKTDVINTNGIYYTYLVASDNAHCCVVNHITYVLHTTDEADMTYENMLANGTQIGNFGADCGSAIPTEAMGPKTTDNCMNQMQYQSGTQYAIMYLKDACEG